MVEDKPRKIICMSIKRRSVKVGGEDSDGIDPQGRGRAHVSCL